MSSINNIKDIDYLLGAPYNVIKEVLNMIDRNLLGLKIREARGNRSLREFAELCGISHTYLDCIEKGTDFRTGKPVRVTADVIKKLADGAKLDPVELFQLSLNDQDENYAILDAQYDFKDVTIGASAVLRLPLYTQIACGSAMFVGDNVEEYITLPVSLLHQNKEYFCQYAKGDSMIEENINDGDLLIFEKTSTIINGQIGCFCVNDNMATCKKFYKDDTSAIITLQPANRKYAPIIVTVETMNFHVVGKLVLVINRR